MTDKNVMHTSIFNLKEFKEKFDQHLDTFLDTKIESAEGRTNVKVIKDILEHGALITRKGGKRIRPYLGYLGYMASRSLVAQAQIEDIESLVMSDLDTVFDILIGLELFHAFALVHDDIIDKGEERHSVPTVHSFVSSLFVKTDEPSSHISSSLPALPGWSLVMPEHIGISQAILTGDVLYLWSNEALLSKLVSLNLESEMVTEVQKEFYEMIEEVIIGQMIDVSLSTKDKVEDEEIEQKNLLKTARYTFVHPLKIGSLLVCRAEQKKELFDFFDEFGDAIGTAFQIQDDLIDIVGDSSRTGKTILRDIEEGQHTYFTQYIFKEGTDEEKIKLKSMFGHKLDAETKDAAMLLFINSGAIDSGRILIDQKLMLAEHSIRKSKLNNEIKQAFTDIIALLRNRTT